MKIRKTIKLIINILLFAIMLFLTFLITIVPRDWLYPDRYTDNAQAVIIGFSFIVFYISIILGLLNRKMWRKKRIWIALILPNLFTLYKVLDVVRIELFVKGVSP